MRGRREPRECRRGAVAVRRVLGAWVFVAALGCGGSTTGERASVDASADAFAPGAPDASNDDGALGDDVQGCIFGCPMTDASATCPPGSPLSCFVNNNCPGGGLTSLSGTVYDPAGRNPIYNAAVFVPEDPSQLSTIATGTSSCKSCGVLVGGALTVTLTDEAGHFLPAGRAGPLRGRRDRSSSTRRSPRVSPSIRGSSTSARRTPAAWRSTPRR